MDRRGQVNEPPPRAVEVDTRAGASPQALVELAERVQRTRARRAEAELAELRASTAWRLSAPLRLSLAWLKGLRQRLGLLLVQSGPGLRLYVALRRRLGRSVASAGGDDRVKADHRQCAEAALAAFLDSGQDLALPAVDKPRVSIILVLYNRAELTLACLQSIVAHCDLAAEVLIVDNASTDRSNELLARLSGARIVRNADNRGFVVAVNQAAAMARGDSLLLLNNDAELFPGSIAAAFDALESGDDIGAVGGRIVLLDGRLQEAGSLIWSDGSCLGYGRGQDPDAPEFQFRREVDYCSGAFLLTPRRVFEELGRFDEAFAPAYYEETDYCVRLRKQGYRVLYEPQALLRHVEFASSASSEQAISLQSAHRKLFQARHADYLAGQERPDPRRALFARSPRGRRRLLLIDDLVPDPRLGAGYPRARDLVNALVRQGFEVTFYPMVEQVADWAEVYRVLPGEVEVMQGQGLVGLADFVQTRRGFYDTVVISRPHNMRQVRDALADDLKAFGCQRLVYDAEAVIAPRDIQRRTLAGEHLDQVTKARLVDAEINLARDVDCVVAVSAREAGLFAERDFARVEVLGHRLAPYPGPAGFEQRSGFLFVGALRDDASPNVDSLLWFCEHVAPRLKAELGGEFRLYVVGDARAPALARLDFDWLHFLGQLDSLRLPLDACRVFIAPTRFAAGIPHKLHAAAAGGLPAVATGVLAGQLGWADGRELLVGDTPEAFAAACLRLYRESECWQAVRQAALAAVARDGSPEAFQSAVAAIFGSG
ncbi:MAG: glycosyltransferase [Wenzhouxiangella sp.]|nr:MAG: glycosyltransferase [Wenzhouxiangella sp.]